MKFESAVNLCEVVFRMVYLPMVWTQVWRPTANGGAEILLEVPRTKDCQSSAGAQTPERYLSLPPVSPAAAN
jgi:hypothetical protein